MMKGLLLKDILALKQQSIIYSVIVLVWAALGIIGKNGSFFAGAMGLIGVLLILSCFAYDEKANWDRFALTTPVSRVYMVLSKYFLTFLFAVVSFLLSLLMFAVIGGDVAEGCQISLTITGLAFCWISVCLPLIFKFGVEKGRVLIMAVLLLPTLVVALLPNLNPGKIDEASLERALGFLPVIAVILYIASAALSVRIYQKKEF